MKRILFSLLAYATINAPALQAMSILRNPRARLMTMAQCIKPHVQFYAQAHHYIPTIQSASYQNYSDYGETTYKAQAMVPLLNVGLVYGLHDRVKKWLGHSPQCTEEELYHCEFCLTTAKADWGLRLITGEEGRACKELISLLSKKLGIDENIKVFYAVNSPHAAAVGLCYGCQQHKPYKLILISPQKWERYSSVERDFILGHELAHIAQKHDKQPTSNLIENQQLEESRKREYEADEIAVLALGSIEGAMTCFGAQRDVKQANGWSLPKEYIYGAQKPGYFIKWDGWTPSALCYANYVPETKSTHPMNINRCRALLALESKHPDKFGKK